MEVGLRRLAGEFRVPADLLVGHQLPALGAGAVHPHLQREMTFDFGSRCTSE